MAKTKSYKNNDLTSDEIDQVYTDGFLIGSGDYESEKQQNCPYERNTERYKIWNEGFNDGLDAYFKNVSAINKNKNSKV